MSTECPRCGSALTTFTLGGAEAVGCDACGYAGVEVDHSGEPRLVESWEEALERFGREIEDGGESERENADEMEAERENADDEDADATEGDREKTEREE
ncbi:TFIIB-type zinc ribbon-containing protein [Halorubrum cibi]|uniref:TFIIB-type zinc ribbon-containing protein n=1 Tax=Halorubrum cibi TaxID=413815 RepID=UPI00115F4007|nr:zf-TFIIB domain-containing protein [Halorubrum cibi]